MDLKEIGERYILWMVCSFSRLIKGCVVKNKSAEDIVDAVHHGWCLQYGFPSKGFWSDNGKEFQNQKMEEFASRMEFSIKFGPPYNPWSNGLNERNHYSADVTVKKLADERDKKLSSMNLND